MFIRSLVELHVGLHSCLFFSLLEKLFFFFLKKLARQLLDTQLSVELLSFFLLQSRQLLNTWWIDEKALVSSIASRHLMDRSRSFQPFVDLSLDRSSTTAFVDVYYARHLSCHPSVNRDPLACIIFHMFCIFLIIFVSIASCFSFSCRSMVPCSPRSLYVSFLFVSVMSFGFLCPLTIVSKRGRNLRIECLSSGGVIDLGGELHVKGKNVFDVTNLRGELV